MYICNRSDIANSKTMKSTDSNIPYFVTTSQ